MSSTTATSHEPVEYVQGETIYGDVLNGVKSVETEGDGSAAACPPVVTAGVAENEAQRLAQKWRRREQYRIAALVLDVVVLVTTLASIAVAGKVFHDCNNFHRPGSDSPFLDVLATFMVYIFVVIEAAFSLIASLTILICLLRKPESVLLRAPFDQGSFVCLCVSLVLLVLFSGYSFAAPIFSAALDLDPKEPVALCVTPAVRIATLLAFLGVLIANRKLH